MTKPTSDTVARMLGADRAVEVPRTESSELEKFKAAFKHLDLGLTADAWDRPVFAHPHIRSLWEGWRCRAGLLMLETAMRPLGTNRDQSVAVSPTYTYNEDMTQAPRGVKLILLGQGGVAQLAEYHGDPFWIGWAALPRRAGGVS